MEADVDDINGDKYIEFRDGSDDVADVSVSPTETDDDQYLFDLFPSVSDEFQWESLEVAFSFPQLDAEWPQLYLQVDQSIPSSDLNRERDGTTTFSITESMDQYPAPSFVTEPPQEEYNQLEMEVDVAASVLDNGLFETTYNGRETFTVVLV